EQALNIWISKVKPISFDGQTFVLQVPTSFYRDVVLKQFNDKIVSSLSEIMGFEVDIEVISEEDDKTVKEKIKEPIFRPNDSEFFTFDNFMVGESNKYAYNICRAVAENPGTAYNPLFLHGSTGLGKTHLLKAIKYQIEKNNPNYKCIYISSEGFTNELIESIRNKTTQEFKNKYRNADVLLIDDIQFFAGKDSTQEEFFHTYNYLKDGNKQIILASDRPPKDIHPLEDRLIGRFESGIITSIESPELELRVAIVKNKAMYYNVAISDEVAYFIAETIKNNIRKIEGVINKMKADQFIKGSAPTIASVKSNIKDISEENEPLPVLVDKIILEVSRNYDVKPEDIRSRKRQMNIKNARHVSLYILRELTSISLDDIGMFFSNLDHSSVHHAINKVADRMASDNSFKIHVEEIIRNVREK
ncbi:MAG: chromosomal replication initiator protein DnaA, partial [Clostridiales bacterium]|nr:chromosomal replication initiator protein DnaA [Clostridiales bacterium]